MKRESVEKLAGLSAATAADQAGHQGFRMIHTATASVGHELLLLQPGSSKLVDGQEQGPDVGCMLHSSGAAVQWRVPAQD